MLAYGCTARVGLISDEVGLASSWLDLGMSGIDEVIFVLLQGRGRVEKLCDEAAQSRLVYRSICEPAVVYKGQPSECLELQVRG